jgi:DNA (cytosine-5)-methyltransferase 1
MWDVPRFAEYHRYRRIIVENVVEVHAVAAVPVWLQAMEVLGYKHRIVSLNSMFCAPDAAVARPHLHQLLAEGRQGAGPGVHAAGAVPAASASSRRADVEERALSVGKYGARNQYIYTCPTCRLEVVPFYYAALNAIDFSIPPSASATALGRPEAAHARADPVRPAATAMEKYGFRAARRSRSATPTRCVSLGSTST